MAIHIHAIGSNMPSWVCQASNDYAKRLNAPWDTHTHEIPALKRTKNANLDTILKLESESLWQSLPKQAFSITLDRQGKVLSSTQFSQLIDNKLSIGIPISFLIGGPEGLSPEYINKADHTLSLSAMTFPHPMVRVILIEQIYRAWSIKHRHPYHR